MNEIKSLNPSIHLIVRPEGRGDQVASLKIHYELKGSDFSCGDLLARINQETVTIPFCDFIGLEAWDEAGAVPLRTEEEILYPTRFTKWLVGRKTRGVVHLGYQVTPRVVPENYRSSPYFDFRNEAGGANGAGLTFLAEIGYEGICRIQFDWDLSAMPQGSRGVSSFAEGSFVIHAKPEQIKLAFYAVGQIKSITWGDFGFYWFSDPPFDIKETAEWSMRLFQALTRFFEDDNKQYRVFVRKDPFEISGGGTALPRSYLFGYSDAMQPTLLSLKNMLAHEMIHNWTQLEDEPYGSGTWYTEGLTEYYSVMLPLRFNLATLEETLCQIQKRTDQYYTNPVRHLSNMEAAAQSWTDRRAQRIPYGRGFFFLADLDARIKKESGGKKSIDEIARTLDRYARNGRPGTTKDFLRLVKEQMGWDLTDEFEKVASGAIQPPNPDSFDGLFTCRPVMTTEADTGKPVRSWQWSVKNESNTEKNLG